MSSSIFGNAPAASGAKQQIMQQIQQEAAMANARQLVNAINSNCFEKCVPRPGTSLSTGEASCMGQCMEKYMSAWNATAKAYTARLSQERQSAGLGV